MRSRQTGEDVQVLLLRYAGERFLFRLGRSAQRDEYVLKGAMLFVLWGGGANRPTRDLDFTGYGSSDPAQVVAAMRAVCAAPVADDGVVFDGGSLVAEPIRDHTEYRGLRLRFRATLDGARIPMQIDIGFGDRIEPPAVEADYPTLLDAAAPRIRAYPREAVVAEKLHAMVLLGERRRRRRRAVRRRDGGFPGSAVAPVARSASTGAARGGGWRSPRSRRRARAAQAAIARGGHRGHLDADAGGGRRVLADRGAGARPVRRPGRGAASRGLGRQRIGARRDGPGRRRGASAAAPPRRRRPRHGRRDQARHALRGRRREPAPLISGHTYGVMAAAATANQALRAQIARLDAWFRGVGRGRARVAWRAMALISARFWSPVLERQAELHAIVPDAGRGPFATLYLLHGGGDDSSNWLRWSRVERHVRTLPLVVVMPDGEHGFWVDNADGPAYGRALTEDVIGFAERVLPLRRERAGRAIGGLSMGGYGALHVALSRPDLVASAHSHSGTFGLWGAHVAAWGCALTPDYAAHLRRVHGDRQEGSDLDLFALARRARASGASLPALRLDCGTSDALIGENRRYRAHLTSLGVAHEHVEAAGGHDWDYWDARIVEALAFHARALGIAAT